MSNTENEAESIRQEINEYELKSYIPKKLEEGIRTMNEDQIQNDKMLEYFRPKLKEFQFRARPKYEIEGFKKDGIKHQELDELSLDTYKCIYETIEKGEDFSRTITKKKSELLNLRDYIPNMKKWGELIDQLKNNRITLKQFREEKPKDIKNLNNIERQINNSLGFEQDKKFELDEHKQKCILLMKKCTDELNKHLHKIMELARPSFEKQNKGNNNFKEKYIKYKSKYLLLKNNLNEY
jgi:hypothetical protein